MSPNFPCSRFLAIANQAERPAMAVLYSTFGSSTACIKRFAQKFRNRDHLIEIHYDNQTCRRAPRKCYREENFPALSAVQYSALLDQMSARTRKTLVRRVAKIVSDILPLGNERTRFLLSTGLEDNYSPRAFRQLYRVLRPRWPHELVRSPGVVAPAPPYLADFIELHSADARFPKGVPCIFNQDGGRGGASSARKLFSKFGGCEVLFSWTARAQGIGKVFVAPLQRAFTITDSDMIEHAALLLPPPLIATNESH